MHKIIIIISLMALCLGLNAKKLSVAKGVLLSLAVPGAGHYYAGNNLRAGIYFGTDIAFLLTGLAIKQESELSEKNYKKYANVYAGAPLGQSEEYYQTIDKWDNIEDYNNERLNIYGGTNMIDSKKAWNWQSKAHFKRYHTKRQNQQRLEVYSSLAFTAMIINRVAATADVMRYIKRLNRNIGGELSLKPDLKNKGLNLSYEIKF